MVKISREQYLKDKDSILVEYKENPSFDVKEISKKLGFSEQKIYKIIREYKSSLDPNNQSVHKECLRQFFVLIKINEYTSIMDTMDETFKNVFMKNYQKKHFKIEYSGRTYGKTNFLFQISSKDILDVKMFCHKVKKMIGPDLNDIDIIEILQPFDHSKNAEN